MRDATPVFCSLFSPPARLTTILGFGIFVAGAWPSNVQAQAPTLVSLLPTRNAVAAPRTTSVTATFNQPLGTTFNAGQALRVFSSASGLKAGTTSVQGNTLTLKPSVPFQAGELVSATVTAVTQGNNGAPVQPQVFQFIAATSPSTGTFATGYEFNVAVVPATMDTGDIDGDGDQDLVIGYYSGVTPSVRTYLNQGNNTFQAGTTVNVSVVTSSVVLSDVDGDGDLDLLTAQRGGGATAVYVRRNDGTGTFSGNQQVATGNGVLSLFLGDVEGDGDQDLFTTNYIDGTVSVRLNDGMGGFASGQDLKVGPTEQAFSASLGDVDNDGDLDLVTTYGLRLNIGNGLFSSTTQADVVGGLVDLDGDGDLDLLNNGIRFNNGNGVFGSTQQVGVSGSPQDIDGDGDLDLASLDAANSSISVRRNNGSGLFGASQQVGSVPGTINAYGFADIDGNGTLDLLALTGGFLVGSPVGQVKVRLNPLVVLATTGAQADATLHVYPNPSHDRFTLECPSSVAQAATLTLTDPLGRVVQQQAVSLRAGANQIPVTTQHLRAGMYQLTLGLANGQQLHQRVLMQP